jgi:hypothetical protein
MSLCRGVVKLFRAWFYILKTPNKKSLWSKLCSVKLRTENVKKLIFYFIN